MNNDITVTPATLRAMKRDMLNFIETLDKALELSGEVIDTDFDSLPLAEKTTYIIDGSCRFFGIRQEDLFKRVNTGRVVQKKRYIAKLLMDYAYMRQVDVADLIGLSRSAVANTAIKLEEQLSESAFGDSRVRTVWASLLAYLKLTKVPALCV